MRLIHGMSAEQYVEGQRPAAPEQSCGNGVDYGRLQAPERIGATY
jgi:hypothetical protein